MTDKKPFRWCCFRQTTPPSPLATPPVTNIKAPHQPSRLTARLQSRSPRPRTNPNPRLPFPRPSVLLSSSSAPLLSQSSAHIVSVGRAALPRLNLLSRALAARCYAPITGMLLSRIWTFMHGVISLHGPN